MLYNNKKRKQISLLEKASQPYIGVIETTMMYQSNDNNCKENVISVSFA